MKRFAVGDVVQLKSGGPMMTVVDASLVLNDDCIRCRWFEGAKSNEGTFPIASLDAAHKKAMRENARVLRNE